jgi:hypothetical protein
VIDDQLKGYTDAACCVPTEPTSSSKPNLPRGKCSSTGCLRINCFGGMLAAPAPAAPLAPEKVPEARGRRAGGQHCAWRSRLAADQYR